MNVRAMAILALVAMVPVSGVVALIFFRNMGYITDSGVQSWGWGALRAGWPVYLFFALTLSLVFGLIQSYILEGVYLIDTERTRRELETAAERRESDLAFERKKLEQEKSELWDTKMYIESERRRVEGVLKLTREISDRANRIEAESKRAVAEIKEKMRHKEGYQRRYKAKLAKLNDE